MDYSPTNNAEDILRNLIGIDGIVSQFERFRQELRFGNRDSVYPNMTFSGNHGTGKTTVAKLFGQILHQDGLLKSDSPIVEVCASELDNQHVSETGDNIHALCHRAKGGLLIIDEADRLNDGGEWAEDVVEELAHFMDNNRDTIIILIGTPDGMIELRNSNPSLQEQIPNHFIFKDYTNEELTEMFVRGLGENGYKANEAIADEAMKHFSSITRDKYFENAKEVNRLLGIVIGNRGRRLLELENPDTEQLGILPEDFKKHQDTLENESEKEDTIQQESEAAESHSDSEEIESQSDIPNETPSDASLKIEELQQTVSSLKDVIDNIQVNVTMLVSNQANEADVAVMRRENEAFRSDSNMKLMRRYGIDAMIKTYQAICDKIFRIKHPRPEDSTEATDLETLRWVLNRMKKQFKPLGIKLIETNPGEYMDESFMELYGSNGEDVEESETKVYTNDATLIDTVIESVCPAFIWTIPSLIGDVKEWCMEKEKVCIYKNKD